MDFPNEVILEILKFLDIKSLAKMRETCTSIEDLIRTNFRQLIAVFVEKNKEEETKTYIDVFGSTHRFIKESQGEKDMETYFDDLSGEASHYSEKEGVEIRGSLFDGERDGLWVGEAWKVKKYGFLYEAQPEIRYRYAEFYQDGSRISRELWDEQGLLKIEEKVSKVTKQCPVFGPVWVTTTTTWTRTNNLFCCKGKMFAEYEALHGKTGELWESRGTFSFCCEMHQGDMPWPELGQ